MRFLLDQNLPARLAQLLAAAGHDAVHVSVLGMSTAPDHVILDTAAKDSRVVISADTDFGGLLAAGHHAGPSVILIRRQRPRRPEALATLLLSQFEAIESALAEGAIVVIEAARIRIRRLPIVPPES